MQCPSKLLMLVKLPAVISLFLMPITSSALVINLNDLGGAAENTQAGAGFREAANIWSSIITDPITLNMNIGFANLGGNTLAQASSNQIDVSYSDIRDALIADQTSIDDATATSHLQNSTALEFLTSTPDGSTVFDNNQTNNNIFLSANTANLKALNLLNNPNVIDGQITFNNAFNYDFDGSDGIGSGLFDFVGIAVHEIGHALGFISGVDFIDHFSGQGPNTGAFRSFEQLSIFSILDLFRYSVDSAALGVGIQDLSASATEKFMSIDGGQTLLAPFATGRNNGDGHQASHFKDNLNLGIMDPTFSSSEFGQISANDLLALDIIGYDLALFTAINSPDSLLLMLFGLLLLTSTLLYSTHNRRLRCTKDLY